MIKNLVIPTYLFDGLGIAINAKYIDGLNVFMIRMDNSWAGEKMINNKNKDSWLSIGSGIIDIYDVKTGLKKLQELNKSETFILFDFNYGYKLAEKIREMGFIGLMPTKQDREMEEDRNMAQDFVNKYYPELKTTEKYNFKKVDDFYKFLKTENKNIYVIKPNNPDLSTFVPNNTEDAMTEMYNYCFQNKVLLEKDGFIAQRKITNGFEITPEVIFSLSGEPIFSSVNIETKKFGNFGTSYMTGCSSDLVFPVNLQSEIIKKCIEPIYPIVKERAKTSPIIFWDAAIMYDIDNQRPYFLEFCPQRFGINSFYTEMEIFGSVSNFIKFVMGEKIEINKDIFAASIRLFNPQYAEQKLPLPNKINKHEWILDITKNEKSIITTTKFGADAVIITSSANNPFDALKNVQELAFNEKWNLFYKRSDLVSTGFNESIIDRYENSLQYGLFDVNMKLNG